MVVDEDIVGSEVNEEEIPHDLDDMPPEGAEWDKKQAVPFAIFCVNCEAQRQHHQLRFELENGARCFVLKCNYCEHRVPNTYETERAVEIQEEINEKQENGASHYELSREKKRHMVNLTERGES